VAEANGMVIAQLHSKSGTNGDSFLEVKSMLDIASMRQSIRYSGGNNED
jgi:hypothetical protein